VNIAAQQIKEPSFINKIEQIFAETGLDGSCLQLEITSMLMGMHKRQSIQLPQIRARKIQLKAFMILVSYSVILHRFPIIDQN